MVVAMDSLPEKFLDSLVARIYNCVSTLNRVLMIEWDAKCCVCQALHGISIYASHACLHCSDNLCDKCAKGHNSSSLTHAHMAVPVSDIRSGKVKKEAQRKYSCDIGRHGNQYFEFYCIRCSQPICSMCLLTKHKGHDFELLDKTARTRRKHITALSQSMHKSICGALACLNDKLNVMEPLPEVEHSFPDILPEVEHYFPDIHAVKKITGMGRFMKPMASLMSSLKDVDTASNYDILKFYSELNECMEHIMNSTPIIQKRALYIESVLSQRSESSVGTAGKGARPKKTVISPDIHCEKDTTPKGLTPYEEATLGNGYSFRLTKCLTVVGKHGYDCNNGSSYDYSNDPNFSYTGSCNPPTGVFADVFLPPDGWLETSSSSNSDSALTLIECELEDNAVSGGQGHTPKDDSISSPEATGSSATATGSHLFPSSHRRDASEKEALGTQRDRTIGKEILTENEDMQISGPVPQATCAKFETDSRGHELRSNRSQYSITQYSSGSEDPGTKMAASVRQNVTLESTRKTERTSRSEDTGTKMAASVRQNVTLESTRKTERTSRSEDTGTKMAASVRQNVTLESTRKTEHSSGSEDPGTKMAANVRQNVTLESTRKTERTSRSEDPGTKMAPSARQNVTLESTRKTQYSSRSKDPGTKMATSVHENVTLESTRKTQYSSRSEDPGTKMATSVHENVTLESTRKTQYSSRSKDPGTKMATSVHQNVTLESTRKTQYSSRFEDFGTKMAASARQVLKLEYTRKTQYSSRSEYPGTKMAPSARQNVTLESTRKTQYSSRSEDPGAKTASRVRQNVELKRKSDLTMTEFLGNVVHSIYNWYMF